MRMMKTNPLSYRKQSGSVLIVVIFVVVVMGLLAATMARLEWSNQDTQSREIMGNRAWFMAHSANEWALTYLYPLNQSASDPADIEARCTTLQANSAAALGALFSSESEYSNCTVKVLNCRAYNVTADTDKYTYFKLHAEATCGDSQGLFAVERAQDVVVKAIK
ncbi:MSHA biogenesis protein MshP [Vibrio rumoiensis]|uniref:MSHA biogenesis protein MshP n=1 Tax=Vibrio rumoiensis TaxID=76258 RepID=UPI000D785C7E|nr:MSHA biogenesis protein MshP [Vibrio rumoiensis]